MSIRKIQTKTTTADSLLGLLSVGPMSGYELRQMIDGSIGNFWSESFGQIYPALKRMLADGLIELKEGKAEGRVEKKIYALTEQGRERLREWLALPAVEQVPRNELLLKLFFGEQADTAKMRELVRTRREDLIVNLMRYVAIEKQISETHAGNPALPFWLMTVRYGKAEATALLAWCDESLKVFEEM